MLDDKALVFDFAMCYHLFGEKMKNKPTVAIVGRPNVGKSTFFNKIAGKRISIVKDTPGVTRDRIITDAEWLNYKFLMIDTGGLDLKSTDEMQKHIMFQAQLAIDVADVVLFIVDGKDGLVGGDFEVAEILRKSKKPVVLGVNKIDNNGSATLHDFWQLGLGEPYGFSAEHSRGLGDVLDAVTENFPKIENDSKDEKVLNIAIVGRPNVGKSSLTNRLLGEQRVVVSDVAGTTRDSIDTPFRWHNQDFVLIDTAGMRKKGAIDYETIEYYSVIRAIESIRRADIVLVVLDASEPITEQDVKIAGLVHEQGKPSVIVYNKWDKIEKDQSTVDRYKTKLNEDLKFMNYFMPLFVSATSGQRLDKIMPAVLKVHENASRRLSTSALNEVLVKAITVTPPPTQGTRQLKIKYMTQASTHPPTFILFVNNSDLLHFAYERFLENRIRASADFSGTPIKLICRSTSEYKK